MDKRKLIHSAHDVFETYLLNSVLAHLEKVAVPLQEAVNVGVSNNLPSDIKRIQKTLPQLHTLFVANISKRVMALSTGFDQKEHASKAFESDDGWEGLSLLSTKEIDRQLLIDNHVISCERSLSKHLYALRQRLIVITNRENLEESTNPFGPSALMNSYARLIELESYSNDAERILYQSFYDVVLVGLGEVLDEVNALLIEAGVLVKLPKAPIKKGRPAGGGLPVSGHAPSHLEQRDMTEQGVNSVHSGRGHESTQKLFSQERLMEPALYASLLDMAKAYRLEGGDKVSSDGLRISGEQLATSDLISTLTNIQKTGVVAGVDLQESVRSQIGMKIEVGGQRQPYGEQDDTLIDVVAMFFDVILQDRHLPNIVRAMIAQLQIPILKVAMMDKDFFAKKSHPSRQFLNALSHAGLGVSEKNAKIKSAVFEKMEELVARVLMDFDNDVEIFAELFEEFEIFMGQQQRQIDLIEERSRKATKSSEQLELTKRKAAYEIALRLNGHTIPEFVQLFLDDAWKDVLVLALLRQDREPQEADKCMQVIERLINSVGEPADNKEKESLLADLGRLLKDLKVGLENISYDFHQSAPFFKELESWHRRVLVLDVNEQEERPDVDEVMMVDFDEDLSMESLEASLLQELGDTLSAMPKDKFSKWANNMQMGDWIEYSNAEDEVLRAKLSWKSSVTSNCLFVDVRGGKALDISLLDFAEELRQKRINLLGQEKAPLVDRVLLGMKNFIKGDVTEASLA